MAHRIVRIEPAGPDKRARLLVFDDDTTRLTSAAVIRTIGLAEDDVLEVHELEGVEASCAKDRALAFIGYRERTTHEVSSRLTADGYPATLVAEIVSRHTELGLIDDERFAGAWSATRSAAGYGPHRVQRELLQKGIDPDLARRVTADDTGDALQRARAALHGRTAGTHAERQRLLARLVRRGFDVRTALEAIRPGEDGQADDEPFVPE